MRRAARPSSRRPAAVLVLAAFPARLPALRAARALVRGRLLACATVHSGATAIYRWKGRGFEEPSTLLWGKTTAGMAARALRAIRALHPDEVAEVLVLPVAMGNARYLAWIRESVGSKR